VSTLPSELDPATVLSSYLIASFASYVALDLAQRVRSRDAGFALAWWIGGSLTMGTGVWCMHFVGMLAFSLPIALGYTSAMTFCSWGAGVAACGIGLFIASRPTVRWRTLTAGALAMGGGISAMHYLGMAALEMVPGIVWNLPLVLASIGVAAAASAAALLIFLGMRRVHDKRKLGYQLAAALIMGGAICGMHYTGMAAASFPVGSVCLSADALSGSKLATLAALASVGLLGMTLLTSILDSRLQGKTARFAASLKVANAQLHEVNAELKKRTLMDPLTGLPNRLLFEDRLGHALRRYERAVAHGAASTSARIAVLFVDLDRFKPINDSLGHAGGDAVLIEAGRRLREAARACDTVARIGGDEFVLLLEEVAGIDECAELARRLLQSLSRPFSVANQSVDLSASIGIAVCPDHGQDDKLISRADVAMYTAKRAGGGTHAVFEAHMDANALEQLGLQADLRRALELRQFELHYQPKVDARSGRIRGVEALLRWRHPVRGLVSPGVFIPIAERFGLIGAIGGWVIDEACRQMEAWADDGMRMRVAINLSAHQLLEDDLVERIGAALARHGVEPAQLLCEITESTAMGDVKTTQRAFDALSVLGVFLSIDDFGTGYSSLSYLRRMPARQLKIDQSFVDDVASSSDARAIVSGVIELAHALGLRVVAEGVETAEQRDILIAMKCDELQGFYFARPMTAAALLAWADGARPPGSVDFSPSVMFAES
jgi:diguanylate cyclase (GGDEF)-like protein